MKFKSQSTIPLKIGLLPKQSRTDFSTKGRFVTNRFVGTFAPISNLLLNQFRMRLLVKKCVGNFKRAAERSKRCETFPRTPRLLFGTKLLSLRTSKKTKISPFINKKLDQKGVLQVNRTVLPDFFSLNFQNKSKIIVQNNQNIAAARLSKIKSYVLQKKQPLKAQK